MKAKYQYIYLDPKDRATLSRQARKYQLCLSTYVNIIHENISILVPKDKYLHHGEIKIHLKLRENKAFEYSDIIVTNSVYVFLHMEELEHYKELNIKKIRSKIQSTCDKTEDTSYLKNQIIREIYRLNKEKHKKGK